MTTSNTETGLFIASFQIGESMPGGIIFTLHLTVNTPNELVNGMGRITQAINPPLDIHTKLDGSYTYMTVMPNNSHILVTASGYPPVSMPPGSGIGPVILPNCELRMILDSTWQSGTANYKFLNADGVWQSVNNAPATAINGENISSAAA